jgi:hypothetical protein
VLTSADTSKWIRRTRDFYNRESFEGMEIMSSKLGDAYYNLLNIVGYRLNQHESASITLIGSDVTEGVGESLANSVRKYLVETWGIVAHRINTKGRVLKGVPSSNIETTPEQLKEAELEVRRVEIVSNDPSVLRNAKVRYQHTTSHSQVVRLSVRANLEFVSCQVTVSNSRMKKSFGPFTTRTMDIDVAAITSGLSDGDVLVVECLIKTTDGRILSARDEIVMQGEPVLPETQRHVLSGTSNITIWNSETDSLVSKISKSLKDGQKILVWWPDDIPITDSSQSASFMNNSLSIANKFRQQIAAGGLNVPVEVGSGSSFGLQSSFQNKFPEGRMYNRCLVVDILK